MSSFEKGCQQKKLTKCLTKNVTVKQKTSICSRFPAPGSCTFYLQKPATAWLKKGVSYEPFNKPHSSLWPRVPRPFRSKRPPRRLVGCGDGLWWFGGMGEMDWNLGITRHIVDPMPTNKKNRLLKFNGKSFNANPMLFFSFFKSKKPWNQRSRFSGFEKTTSRLEEPKGRSWRFCWK